MRRTRMTKQRSVILETLRGNPTHPTADEVYGMVRKIMPRISLGTVYRNLDLLAGSGEILRLERAGAQKRFDGNPCPHHHVRCEECGVIGDVFTPVALPDLGAARVSPEFAFISGMEVEFTGLCERCRQSRN